MKAASILCALGVASAANAGITLDDLSIGTLFGGDSVMGDTSTSSNDMSHDIISNTGTWSGGDDVYTLVWGGGDFTADLLFTNALGDIDIALMDSNTPDGDLNTLAEGLSTDDNENIAVAGLAAGTYWLSIDGFFGDTNSYTLNIGQDVPAPAAMALLGLGGLAAGRRRR